jgi:parallel beta helix pectate lyase-like protein
VGRPLLRPLVPTCIVAALVACLCCLPASSAAAPAVACAKVAAPTGDDAAPGDEAQPFRSAQRLADALAPGETGCLRGGRYDGGLNVVRGGAPEGPITVRSWPGEQATIAGRVVVTKSANFVTFEELYFDGRNPEGLPSPTVNGDDVVFARNDVTNHHSAICFVLGASNIDNSVEWGRSDRAVLQANRIHDCGKLPATNHDHGVYVEGGDDIRIVDNWIYDNADRGVQLYPDAQRAVVTGNVIDGNGTGVVFSGEGATTSNENVVQANVITNSTMRPNVESWWGGAVGRGNVLRGNCLRGGPRDTGDGGVETADGGFAAHANVVADPAFVNRAGKDFRLAPNSGCRRTFRVADAIPGPGGTAPAPAPRRAHPARAARALRFVGRPRALRAGRKLRVRIAVDRRRIDRGRRILLVLRNRRGAHVIGHRHVGPSGRVRFARVLRPRSKAIRLVAVVRGTARSHSIRVAVRH